MKKFLLVFAGVLALSTAAMAGEWTGYISDAGCAKKMGAKVANATHEGCAQACVKRGDQAVLVTDDGKVFNVANQDKVVEHAGQKVTLTGSLKEDTITVSAVKM
jgi:hypothetical protein